MKDSGKAVKMTITPDMAKKMLAKSRPNRNIRTALLARLVKDIKTGNWRITGETIIFDDEGYLIDGQHRLQACIEADIPIMTYVVMGGISTDAIFYTDIGAAKSPGDALSMMGVSSGNTVASALRWIHRYNTNGMAYKVQTLPRAELITSYIEYSDLPESAIYGRRVLKFMTLSMATALHYLMAQKNRSLANYFFTELGAGSDDRTSPIFVLREKLTVTNRRIAKHPEHYIAAWTIKAWNLLREGKTAKIINWYPDSPSKPEPFPTIR